jgi:FkbM family methyltransferase
MPSYEERRIAITTAVRDTDRIPKVPNAGSVEQRDGTSVQVMHNGVVIEEGCYYPDWTTEIIRNLRGHHEPQEEVAFHALVERLREEGGAPVMLELGSFWAYYSLWLKHAVRATRCLLAEPDPEHLEVGRRNFALNGVSGEFIHAAVGRHHNHSVRLVLESDGMAHRVPGVTVDGLCAERGVERLDVLLIDVQGAELDALRGAREAIRERRIRFFVVSTHHHSHSGDPLTHQRCLRFLQEAGAHLIAEHSVSESCSGDGLIVASLDPRDADLRVDVSVVRARDSLFGELEWDLAAAKNLRLRASRAARKVVTLTCSAAARLRATTSGHSRS